MFHRNRLSNIAGAERLGRLTDRVASGLGTRLARALFPRFPPKPLIRGTALVAVAKLITNPPSTRALNLWVQDDVIIFAGCKPPLGRGLRKRLWFHCRLFPVERRKLRRSMRAQESVVLWAGYD
jgi:hypothetical protein